MVTSDEHYPTGHSRILHPCLSEIQVHEFQKVQPDCIPVPPTGSHTWFLFILHVPCTSGYEHWIQKWGSYKQSNQHGNIETRYTPKILTWKQKITTFEIEHHLPNRPFFGFHALFSRVYAPQHWCHTVAAEAAVPVGFVVDRHPNKRARLLRWSTYIAVLAVLCGILVLATDEMTLVFVPVNAEGVGGEHLAPASGMSWNWLVLLHRLNIEIDLKWLDDIYSLLHGSTIGELVFRA